MEGPSPQEMGLTAKDMEIKPMGKSLSGKELPTNWPQIISPQEENQGYKLLYDPGENQDLPPTHQQIDRLSYTLKNNNKELRFLAVEHIGGPGNRNHPQFVKLRENFEQQKPQVILLEGPQGSPTSITEDDAYMHGERAYMEYLVLEHNKHLKPGEAPIMMASCDIQPQDEPAEYRKKGYSNEEIAAQEVIKWMYGEANHIKRTPLPDERRKQQMQELQAKYETNPFASINPNFLNLVPRLDGQEWNSDLMKAEIQKITAMPLKVDIDALEVPRLRQMFEDARQFRDQHVIKTIADYLKKYDRVMTVMGSGHAIRDKQALEQFFQ